jgi:hypothetical protein
VRKVGREEGKKQEREGERKKGREGISEDRI